MFKMRNRTDKTKKKKKPDFLVPDWLTKEVDSLPTSAPPAHDLFRVKKKKAKLNS